MGLYISFFVLNFFNNLKFKTMKSVKFFFVAVLLMATGVIALPQTAPQKSGGPKTETFKVWGKCDMCKDRIEKTAKEGGATTASWDVKTAMLTVSYDPSKTSKDALSKKLAAVGHDTEKYKADDKVYNALPACCHYERAK
jgi:periplasmic mercuric ion binding protein